MKIIIVVFLLNIISLSFFSQTDSLKILLNQEKHDSIKSNELLQYGIRLNLMAENDNALKVLSKCTELAVKCKQPKIAIIAYRIRAFILAKMGQNEDAEEIANQLLNYSVQNKLITGRAYGIRLLAIIETNKGNLEKSLKYYLAAQTLWEETRDSVLIVEGYSDIGLVFLHQNDFNNTIKYYKKTSEYYIAHGNFYKAIYPLSNMSLAYIKLKQYDAAEKIFKEILPIVINDNDINMIIAIYANMSLMEQKTGNLDKAIEYTYKCIKLLENTGELSRIGVLYSNLGDLYREKKDFKKAEQYLFIGLKFVLKSKNLSKIYQSYDKISAFYYDLKKFELAMAYQDTFYIIHDSIYSFDKLNQIRNLEKRFDSKQKEKKIESLNMDRLLQESELKKQKNLIYSFILSVILLIVIAFFIYRNYKIKKEKEKNALELLVQNAELTALKAQMNPHFIFNALNSIQHSIVTNNTEDAYRFLAKFSKLIRNILDNSSQQLIPLKTEIETLSLYLDVESKRFDNSFSYKININDNGYSIENIVLPPMILQPFIENAIWHGLMAKMGDKNLNISFTVVSLDYLICEIIDNGIGRIKAMQIAAEKNKAHKSKGISNIYDRVDLLEKTHSFKIAINIKDCLDDNNLPNGTKIVVEFKKNKSRV